MSNYRYVNSNLHTAINVLKMFFFSSSFSAAAPFTYFFSFAISSDANDSDFRPPCELQFKIRQNAQKENNNKKDNFRFVAKKRYRLARKKHTHTHCLEKSRSRNRGLLKGGGVENERIHREDCNFTRTAILNEIKIVCTFQSAMRYKKKKKKNVLKVTGNNLLTNEKSWNPFSTALTSRSRSRRSRHLCKNKNFVIDG